jgi:hypothetical protein
MAKGTEHAIFSFFRLARNKIIVPDRKLFLVENYVEHVGNTLGKDGESSSTSSSDEEESNLPRNQRNAFELKQAVIVSKRKDQRICLIIARGDLCLH